MRTLTVEVPPELARLVEEKVASGQYASEGEVLLHGLRLLDDHAPWPSDDWLRSEVLPIVDACELDPSRLKTSEDVFQAIEARHGEEIRARRS